MMAWLLREIGPNWYTRPYSLDAATNYDFFTDSSGTLQRMAFIALPGKRFQSPCSSLPRFGHPRRQPRIAAYCTATQRHYLPPMGTRLQHGHHACGRRKSRGTPASIDGRQPRCQMASHRMVLGRIAGPRAGQNPPGAWIPMRERDHPRNAHQCTAQQPKGPNDLPFFQQRASHQRYFSGKESVRVTTRKESIHLFTARPRYSLESLHPIADAQRPLHGHQSRSIPWPHGNDQSSQDLVFTGSMDWRHLPARGFLAPTNGPRRGPPILDAKTSSVAMVKL